MKKKVVNQSLALLVFIVSFGLFQAWKESKNPFALYSNTKKIIDKPNYVSDKSIRYDTKKRESFLLANFQRKDNR